MIVSRHKIDAAGDNANAKLKASATLLLRCKGDGRDLRRAFGRELRRLLLMTARDAGHRHVHTVRKGITKLRSWLRLVREPIGWHRFHTHNRRLRRAARMIAPMRDASVMLATFQETCSGASFPNSSRHLHKLGRRAKKMTAMRQVKHRLKEELAALDRLPLKQISGADFAAGLERLCGEMTAAAVAARANGNPEALHTWRKRTKNYLRALDFVVGEKNRRHQALARLNRLLGQDHDLALLEAELVARGKKPESRPLLDVIAERRAKLRRQFFHKPIHGCTGR